MVNGSGSFFMGKGLVRPEFEMSPIFLSVQGCLGYDVIRAGNGGWAQSDVLGCCAGLVLWILLWT